MTELMNLEMVLPAPLNPPFPERAKMSELGRVHFIGIGGAGMSAIAALMLQAGVTVSGSDRAESATVESLRAAVLVWVFLSRLRTLWMLIPW